MANLRDIRRRIKSVKNTAQITKAMQLVAASKMKKAQDQATSGRPYAELLNRVLNNLSERTTAEDHPLLRDEDGGPELVILITTDKGLCGPLNTNLLRLVMEQVPKDSTFITIGNKGRQAVVRQKLSQLIAEGQDMVGSFEGSTSDLLRQLTLIWWERFGDTPAAGIHKVVISEVRNFPELAQFYADEVITPADRLFSSTVERGIARGEFRPLPVHDVAHALMAPMIFMALHRHSFGACPVHGVEMDPMAVLNTQLDLVLRGLETRT